jgi:SAM-dependent methyltransferase
MNPAKPQPAATWVSGAAYEAYVGRWSRLVARKFLAWLSIPLARRWLDAGCGTGALAETILREAAPRTVTGIDTSLGFIPHAHSRLDGPHARFLVGDLQALPLADAAFDAAVSGLVLNFVTDQLRAVAEIARAVRPGGVVAAYVWDYAGGMQFIRRFWDAAIALNPAAAALNQGERFPICKPEPLAALFQSAGLQAVEGHALDIPTVFRNFDDYWSPFLGGQGPAPAYTMSLREAERIALRERLRTELPIAGDGSIHLTARAWAVRGIA